MIRVYIDGIFDLFHRGHIESLKQAKNIDKDVFLIVGVISDSVATEYKREPVINETDRIEIIKSINIIDMVITDPPLIVTKEFVIKNNIDLVVHGFSNETDWNNQKNFFKWLIENNKFKRINYYEKTSTTNIIKKIKDSY